MNPKNKWIKKLSICAAAGFLFLIENPMLSHAATNYAMSETPHYTDEQPNSRDFERVYKDEILDFSGYLAYFNGVKSATLQISTDQKSWVDSGIPLTISNGKVIAKSSTAKASLLANKYCRIKLDNGKYSDVFTLSANLNGVEAPLPLDGMNQSQVYTYTANDKILLSPNIIEDGYTDNYTIEWMRSDDGGKTFYVINTSKSSDNPSMSYELTASCDMTYSQFKYRITNEAGTIESEPFEVIVYEKWKYDDATKTLVIESAGNGGKMNDYTKGSRLYGFQQWNKYKDKAEKILIGSVRDLEATKGCEKILSIGDDAFSDFSKTKIVAMNEGVKTVGKNAFKNNTSLLSITFPESVEELKDDALANDTALLDIRFENPDTKISSVWTTIPESKETPSNIKAATQNEDLVKDQHSYPVIYGYKGKKPGATKAGGSVYDWAKSHNRAFIPIGAIDQDGVEYRIDWYTNDVLKGEQAPGGNNSFILANSFNTEKTEYVNPIWWDSEKRLEIYIPKTVDGTYVTRIGDLDGNTNLLGLTSNHNEDLYPMIETLHIPDTVTEIADNAFEGINNVETVYAYSKTNLKSAPAFLGKTMWTYSTNSTMRKASNDNFDEQQLFDSGNLSGITGDLKWEINLSDGSLTLSGLGNSDNYKTPSDVPFEWAKDEITSIIIKPGVQGIGKNLYAGLTKVQSITNLSEVLKNIDSTAFTNVGKDVTSGISIKTYVNNTFYDRMEALKGWTKSDLYYNFMTTTEGIGTGVQYTYDASELSLTISGNGATKTWTDPQSVPWRCVNDYIRHVKIESEITALSNNMFNGITNLEDVYNYGEYQTINGGDGNVFDVIKRKKPYSEYLDYVSISTYDGMSKAELINALKSKGIDITENLLEIPKDGSFVIKKSDTKTKIASILNGKTSDYATEKSEYLTANGLVTIGVPNLDHDLQVETVATQARRLQLPLSAEQLDSQKLVAGEYIIKKDAAESDIVDVLTGKANDEVTGTYIVPVYTYGDANPNFNNVVPQPESKGYKLVSLIRAKGQAGDKLYWYLTTDNVLIFEGSGKMWDFKSKGSPWYSYAKDITGIQFDKQMTSIGNFAFEGCQMISSLKEMPDLITSIGTGAFKDCVNLYEFTLKKTVTDLKSGVFAGCTELRILNIEDTSRYYLNDGVLYSRKKEILGYLRDSLYEDVANKKVAASKDSFEIPSDITTVGELAFYNIKSLQKLTISENVSSIKDRAFAGMENLREIYNNYKGKQKVEGTILEGAGKTFTDIQYAIVWKVNNDFVTVAKREGYTIRYYDETKVKKLTAVYAGNPVTIGNSFNTNDVTISIVYDNGQSMTVNGNDQRITFNDLVVKNIGTGNVYTATYNDGYGQILKSNEFTIEGVNAIRNVEFTYNGSAVWYGETFDPANVNVVCTYADGTKVTMKGDATYKTDTGTTPYVTFNKLVIDKVGLDNEITATYQDKTSGKFSGKFYVTGKNFLKELTTKYSGEEVDISTGTNGIALDKLAITLAWADGSVERIDGNDGRVVIDPDYYISGDNLVFELTCNEDNRYDLVSPFTIKYASNIASVKFDYVGQPVTEGTKFNIGDIQLTIGYTNGTSRTVRGDTVTGLTADTYIVNTADSSQEVNLTYTTGGQTFTGTVRIPGKVKSPIKLIVVQRPKKSVYEKGDRFNPDGMIVNCLYDNGATEDVSDKVTIDGGDIMSSSTKYVTLSYYDRSSDSTVKTNMTINVNQNQKVLTQSKTFKEQYEITKILFRSKQTEDTAATEDDTADEDGKWIDVTPQGNKNIYPKDSDIQAQIKAGYGFEIKVYTKYQTNRGGEEFSKFLEKRAWDQAYQSDVTISEDVKKELNTKWKYLNDVYPQYTPTANPDLLYLRIVNGNLTDKNGTKLDTGRGDEGQNFIVLEKTNVSEDGNKIDEGEWYNSEKIFEFPERDVLDSGLKSRKVYLSRDAADPNALYTDYEIQIISPAWYGYEPEPVYKEGKFKHVTEPGEELRQKSWSSPGTQYLHVCAAFTIRATTNDDIHTHILQ